jgi:hypothetical protein
MDAARAEAGGGLTPAACKNSVRESGVDRLARRDQISHRPDGFLKHLPFGWVERNLDNFLDPPFAPITIGTPA